ncbi:MAG: glycoside hydrolase family 3 protein [Rhodobacteraceae bacterium]|nr:glycoside hydrolase family 3 protein [Paracoccaceae bacterium]
MRIDLASAPFHLDAAARDWVAGTLARLSPDQKLRQLFNLRINSPDPAFMAMVRDFGPGGITWHPGPAAEAEKAGIATLKAAAATPLLVAADLEGSRMSLPFGLELPNPVALAAVDDVAATEAIARLMAREARAVGINWTFTPVLDINAAFRSAIVATRGFGADPERILRHAMATLRGFQAEGVAATAKHWPGEGYDDRDQHLVTTINPLSMPEWEATFGRLYRAAIAEGVLSVMSAHIALPAFVRDRPGISGPEPFRPASISPFLTRDLLRGRLGFGGLIVSDATPMAGLGSWSRRAEHLPELLTAGCDVILFSDDPEADLGHLRAAIADGRLDRARVDEALTRQLALKARLGLHLPGADRPAAPFAPTEADRALVDRVTRAAPTLVKDVRQTLPLSPARHRRVLVMTTGIVFPFRPDPLPFALPDMLAAEGFEVTLHGPATGDVTPDRFDLVLYLFGDETLLTRGRIFLDWLKLTGHFGAAMKRSWHDIPSVMVSFGFPYLLYDAPRMPTAINAWCTTESMQRAVADLLLGRGTWNRNSPVDPFAGAPDSRY